VESTLNVVVILVGLVFSNWDEMFRDKDKEEDASPL